MPIDRVLDKDMAFDEKRSMALGRQEEEASKIEEMTLKVSLEIVLLGTILVICPKANCLSCRW